MLLTRFAELWNHPGVFSDTPKATNCNIGFPLNTLIVNSFNKTYQGHLYNRSAKNRFCFFQRCNHGDIQRVIRKTLPWELVNSFGVVSHFGVDAANALCALYCPLTCVALSILIIVSHVNIQTWLNLVNHFPLRENVAILPNARENF